MNSPRIILASTSPYRRALLERLDIPFECRPPICDESPRPGLEPEELVATLAREKALSITTPNALIIGSDQLVVLDGRVFGKPGSVEGAIEQLETMSGRAHRLITAVAVHETTSGTVREAIDIHTLHMRRLDRPTIEAYVRHDMPLNCAGSYMLEKRGLALFEAIEADPVTADDTAVIGLPMTKTIALLRSFGFEPLKA